MTKPADIESINFFDPATLAEPWETYRVLRDEAPVYSLPGGGLKIVTRYDLVMEALGDPETYSSQVDQFVAGDAGVDAPEEIRDALAEARSEMLPAVPTLLTADDPAHARYRAVVKRVFTAGRVRAMEPYTDAVVARATDDLAASEGPVDFMSTFALPVPLRIIADRLGVPTEDRDLFYDGATAAASALRMTVPSPEQLLDRTRLGVRLQNYMVRLVESRRGDPRDDMATVLAEAEIDDPPRPLEPAEIWSILNQFLVAGHETTASTFGAGMLLLCRHPELAGRLRDSPERIENFCEEILRLEAPVQGLPRRVTRAAKLGGIPLAEGDLLMLRYGATNRDERQFPNPDEIDLAREHPAVHLAFGWGMHRCPGAPLSRQELNRGFRALVDRFDGFRLAGGYPEPACEPSFLLRSLPELWIEFDRRAR